MSCAFICFWQYIKKRDSKKMTLDILNSIFFYLVSSGFVYISEKCFTFPRSIFFCTTFQNGFLQKQRLPCFSQLISFFKTHFCASFQRTVSCCPVCCVHNISICLPVDVNIFSLLAICLSHLKAVNQIQQSKVQTFQRQN